MTTNNLNKDQFGDNDYDAEEAYSPDEFYVPGYYEFEPSYAEDDILRMYFGDNYKSKYRAHKAGDIEKD